MNRDLPPAAKVRHAECRRAPSLHFELVEDAAGQRKHFNSKYLPDFVRYTVSGGGAGQIFDLWLKPNEAPGNWSYGEGMVHHGAFAVSNLDVQGQVKLEVECLKFTAYLRRLFAARPKAKTVEEFEALLPLNTVAN